MGVAVAVGVGVGTGDELGLARGEVPANVAVGCVTAGVCAGAGEVDGALVHDATVNVAASAPIRRFLDTTP